MHPRFRHLLPLITLVVLISALSACSYIEDPLLEREGIVRLSMPLVDGYAPDRYFYRLTPSENVDAGQVMEGLLSPGDAAATADLVLPLGDWTISGRLDKNWDESSAYNVPVAEESFSVTVGSDQTVELTNPFSADQAASFSVQADGNAYITALGVPSSDEFVGVFLESTDPDGASYHFHATDDSDNNVYTAAFDRIAAGEYDVEVIATNWSYWGEESVWNPELTASNSARLQVTDDTVYSPELLFEIFQDFSGTSEYYEQAANGGSLSIDASDRLHGVAAVGAIPTYSSTIRLETPKFYSFDYVPNGSNKPNGAAAPTIRVRVLDDPETDTAITVSINATEVLLEADIAGTIQLLDSVSMTTTENSTNTYPISIYVRDSMVYAWLGTDPTSDPPTVSGAIPSEIEQRGRVVYEFVNEAYIDNVLIRNDVRNEYGP